MSFMGSANRALKHPVAAAGLLCNAPHVLQGGNSHHLVSSSHAAADGFGILREGMGRLNMLLIVDL